MALIDAIGTIARQAVEESAPVAVVFGEVTGDAPLTIRVSEKLTLSAGQILVLRMPVVGCRVALLRIQGGQKFLVLGEVL